MVMTNGHFSSGENGEGGGGETCLENAISEGGRGGGGRKSSIRDILPPFGHSAQVCVCVCLLLVVVVGGGGNLRGFMSSCAGRK